MAELASSSKELLDQLTAHINERSELNETLLSFLETPEDEKDEKAFQKENLKIFLKEKQINSNKQKFQYFLVYLAHLLNEHQPTKELKKGFEEIIVMIKNEIKNIFTEEDLILIFKSYKNMFIFLILLEQDLITINAIKKEKKNIFLFYPEFRKYDQRYFSHMIAIDLQLKKFVDENDQDIDNFYRIRKGGEDYSLARELIREDNVDNFINYIKGINFKYDDLLESNLLIISRKLPTPIEYSALFGAIKIFKYLYIIGITNNFKEIMDNAIQGRNSEIINILEGNNSINKLLCEPDNQIKFLKKAIICNHNELFDYFQNKFNFSAIVSLIEDVILANNYQLLHQFICQKLIDIRNINVLNKIFYYSCRCGDIECVKILMNYPNININSTNRIFIISNKYSS